MENVRLFNEEKENIREYSSGKRIKVSTTKLDILKGKFRTFLESDKSVELPKVELEEVSLSTPAFKAPEVEEAFFNVNEEVKKPEVRTYEEVRKSLERKPYSFEVEEKEEKPVKEEPVKTPKEYVVPSIKSPTNVGDRSLKIRQMSESADPNSVVGKVLINGVSKLDENKNEIARIKANIERLESTISDLEKQKEAVSGGKQEIEDILSKTMTVSLTEIREASKLDSSERAKRELDKIKASIDELERIKSEEEARLQKLEQEKTGLEEERSRQKTRLMSAERNGIEICDTIEKDLTTAGQIEKLEKERLALEKQLSLTSEEEPKKPVNIVNPFDKMRMMEEDTYHRAI